MVYADTYKFVVLVNKKLEAGRAMNAVAHCCAGMAASASEEMKEKMSFIDFKDADGVSHDNISGLSLIILRGSNNELKKARKRFIEAGIHYKDFVETMTGGTYEEQLVKTAAIAEDEMEYFCVAAFGQKEQIEPITKRFSLWH